VHSETGDGSLTDIQTEIDDDVWYPCKEPSYPICCGDCSFGKLGEDLEVKD